MTSDLPADLGPAEPGLDQLLRTLASGPAPGELAGEQEALAMFRANIHPPAQGTAQLPAAVPASPSGRGRWPMRQLKPRRPRFRLVAAATTAALVGGFAAAAYTAALPAPVQHVAYQAFHVLGVPDSHHSRAAATRARATSGPSSRSHPSSPAPHPVSSHSAPGSPGPAPSPTPRAARSTGRSTAPAGSAIVVATPLASQIPAGDAVTINGKLTLAGHALSGVTVRLWERFAGSGGWQPAGHATSGAQGAVAINVPALTTNARFRLTDPDGPASSAVLVTVVPEITTALTQGPRGAKDYLAVSTRFARRGDTVVLQGYQDGAWVAIRLHLLNAAGKTVFALGAREMQGVELRVVLQATRRHAQAVSGQVTVPAAG
jgi:hypothetical protein